MKSYILLLTTFLSMAFAMKAQVTAEPSPLRDDSDNVVVYFHADQGNKVLANLPASTKVYAHTGLITDASKDNTDWKYAPTKWGDNAAKYECEYVSPNLYKLNIGNIKTYYGVTSSNEVIKKMAFVFRNTDGSKTAKTADDKDMLLDVISTANVLSFESNLDGSMVGPGESLHFTMTASKPTKLAISVSGPGFSGNQLVLEENSTKVEADYTFDTVGQYNFYGKAWDENGKLREFPIKVYCAPLSAAQNYPGGTPRMGAVRNADGSVTFCLGAPGKKSVNLVGSWDDFAISDSSLCAYQDYNGQRYFWKTIPALEAGKQYMYFFQVDGSINVGDPYARLVLDPYNDRYIPKSVYPDMPAYPTGKVPANTLIAIYQSDINDYAWTDSGFKAPAKKDLIIYELLIRDFTGTEGRNNANGTLKAAMEKLPYLKTLGVNAIELMPIMEFNGNNSWGYNTNFYFAPDKAYGTPDDYKAFIDLCHQNGMAVILDIVFNQSDGLHPWYRMYPVGANPMYNAKAPHDFSVLNDWNQGHPLVRQQWKDCVKYWMEEYHVDGYRFDLVKGLGNNDSYGDTNAYNQSRIDNMRDIQTAMDEINPSAIFINENLAGAAEENKMAEFGMLNWANINNEGAQFAMGYSASSNLSRMYAPKDSRTLNSTVSYLESHDEERIAFKQNKWGIGAIKDDHAAKMHRLGSAAAQMILAPGAHMIWQFGELGNDQTTKSADGGNDTSPKNVRWDDFEDPARRGVYNSYSSLIGIRRNHPELFDSNATVDIRTTVNDWKNGRLIALTRGESELYLVVNPLTSGDLTVSVPFQKSSQDAYHVASSSHDTNPTFSVANKTVTVPANCYAVIATANVNSVEGIASAEAAFMAHTEGDSIVIDHSEAPVSVFATDGTLRALLPIGSSEVSLPSGIYILRSGSHTLKLAL